MKMTVIEYHKNLSLEDIVYLNNQGIECVEQWKYVVGFEGVYMVSDLGRLKSFKLKKNIGGKILKNTNKNGHYFSVVLQYKNSIKYTRIHRLVAELFILNPNNLPVVNHIDCNKQNNFHENLEWVTPRENSAHSLSMYTNKTIGYPQNSSSKFIKKECTSKYIGVYYIKKICKWHCSINYLGRGIFLGSFNTEYEAYLVYQEALKSIKGNNVLVVNGESVIAVKRDCLNSKIIKGSVIKTIVQLNLDGEYISEFFNSKLAFDKTGVCARNILQVASKEVYKMSKEGKSLTRKQAGGFIWKYKEDYEVTLH